MSEFTIQQYREEMAECQANGCKTMGFEEWQEFRTFQMELFDQIQQAKN